jgi:TolB-like protein/Tfp pilus assembly protein PilF
VANFKTAQVRQFQSVEGAAGLRIRLLGPMTVTVNGRPVAIAAKKARALLGYLALREGADVPRGILTGLLWGERSEGQARASLRQTLSELKGALGETASSSILASKEAIAWARGSGWIDARIVESAAGSIDEAALHEAAELAVGELMEGLSIGEAGFEQWLTAERERLRLLACSIHARLMERAEQGGRLEEALAHGLKLLSLDPLQEHVHRGLMRFYAAQGRHDAALAQYERCRRQLSDQLGVRPAPETEDLARSIRTGRRDGAATPQLSPTPSLELEGKGPTQAVHPSVAVLPFINLSSDPEQEYFADGMVEEIITALSRMRSLTVIARNSSFHYKGRSVDVKQVGRELGVRYVLEGSVRKATNRLRIAGQLIDAETGAHLWADRFDGNIEDIFDLQDQVTARVVGAIAPRLDEAEIARIRSKPTDSLDAYDCFLRGMAGLHKFTREGNDEALGHFHRAIELDPNYAAAYGLAARTYVQRNAAGWVTDHPYALAEASRLARRAVELSHDDSVALATAGFALADLVGDIEDGEAFIDRALELNPNLAWAWLYSGWVKATIGDADQAIERIAQAKRLSPHDPQDVSIQIAMAFAHFIAGRYGESLACAQAAVRVRPNLQVVNCLAAASAALAGQPAEARKAMERLLRLNPSLRVADTLVTRKIRRPDDIARWTDGLRQAGLPE